MLATHYVISIPKINTYPKLNSMNCCDKFEYQTYMNVVYIVGCKYNVGFGYMFLGQVTNFYFLIQTIETTA
jgi:hypothetical protein